MTDTNPQADRLEAAARRALESLNDLILDSRYPGPEAIAARYELEQVLLTSSAGPAPAADPTERRDRWETQYARYDAHDYRDLAAIGMAIADAEQDGMRATIGRLRAELKQQPGPSGVADEAQQPAPWLSDSARIGRTLIWTWADIGKGVYGQGYRAGQTEARTLLTGQRDSAEAQQPETDGADPCSGCRYVPCGNCPPAVGAQQPKDA